jgi:oligosaccharyltransferase complex subunit beta
MVAFYVLLATFFGLLTGLDAKSSTGDSVLVVLDNKLDKSDFSLFFGGLEEQGYELTFRDPREHEPVIKNYDNPNFDHLIVFAPETKTFAEDITPQALVSLVESGTNLLLALSPKQNLLNSLASEFSLILPPPGTPLMSHFPERKDPPTIIPIPVSGSNKIVTPNLPPVWFSGVPQALGTNPLLVPILTAPVESFAADSSSDSGAEAVVDASEKGGEGLWAGSSLSVVTGFQARGGGRVTWVGGVDMFTDSFAKKEVSPGKKSGNKQFVRDVAAWTFQEHMVLRIDSVTHHKVNETEPRGHYTINDEIVHLFKALLFISSTYR